MDVERLLQRFLRYVTIDTTADDRATCYPSSPGQLKLGRLLVEELLAMGLADVEQDNHGLVWATLPATTGRPGPVVAFNAHLDTSPETTGANVQPQVVRNYPGGDLPLPTNPQQVIRVSENPELQNLIGKTLVTTDGTTLLGGDDKAGVAVIMEMAEHLLEHPELPRPEVRLLFTCDEEIGRGISRVDLDRVKATVCYTLDGSGANHIDVETFSADLAAVHFRGVNIHPSIARGRMINAVRGAGLFLALLPHDRLAPEVTDNREGFLHPYWIQGGVADVSLKVLLRDFETSQLHAYAQLLKQAAAEVQQRMPGLQVEVDVQPQYRNMREGLEHEPRAVLYAQRAHERLGRQAQLSIIRGGTDGSLLTERGLPTPNLSTGQHNPHSPLEWVCLEEMQDAVEVLVELVQLWAEDTDDRK